MIDVRVVRRVHDPLREARHNVVKPLPGLRTPHRVMPKIQHRQHLPQQNNRKRKPSRDVVHAVAVVVADLADLLILQAHFTGPR